MVISFISYLPMRYGIGCVLMGALVLLIAYMLCVNERLFANDVIYRIFGKKYEKMICFGVNGWC